MSASKCTQRRNTRVHNGQRSRFGFVATQLCGHLQNIYIQTDRDLTALSDPCAIPTRQIYKPRFARNYFMSCVVFFRVPQRGKMRAMSKMSAPIIDQNTEQEAYYSTVFCFCFVLLQQKTGQPGIVLCNTLAYLVCSLALIQ